MQKGEFLRLINIKLLIGCFVLILFSEHSLAMDAKLNVIHTVSDSDKNIDGLDNPRIAKFSADNSQLFIVSGDDNSLAIFDVNQDYTLSLSQVFKSNEFPQQKLEGASDLVTINDSSIVFVASFYDGALSVFDKEQGGKFQFTKAFSDGLSPERVFKSKEPVGTLDNLGLLGAWSVTKSRDGKQVFVAGYMSNTVSLFDMTSSHELKFNRVITNDLPNDIDLGNPVNVVYAQHSSELIISGFEKHKITILSQLDDDKFIVKQQIENAQNGVCNLVNPQKIVLSEDGLYLYVASAGSDSIIVFKRSKDGFSCLQSITPSEVSSGLKGVGSLAISKNGKYLFAGGENDIGLLVFKIVNSGALEFEQHFTAENDKVRSISSINLSSDGKYLVVTSSKDDEVHILKLN